MTDSQTTDRFRQYLAAVCANLGGFMLGTAFGWSASALDIIDKQVVKLDKTEKSWIGSSFTLGAAAVMFPIAYLVDRFGRKIIMLAFAPLLLIGWLVLAFGNCVELFIVGRVITGFGSASYCVTSPLYTGEIAHTEVRGRLGNFFQLLLVIGGLLSFSLGISDSLMVMSIVPAFFPVIFCVCLFFLPETPLFFLLKDDAESAEKALRWLRGKHYSIDQEMKEYKHFVEQSKASKTSLWAEFRKKATIKALVISLGLMACQQLSGINVIIFYNVSIFKMAGSELEAIFCSIILGVVQVFATLLSVAVVDRFGRKLLLLISHASMGVCLLIMGYYFTVVSRSEEAAKAWGPVPLVIVCLYSIMFSLGSGPIPWAIMGEIFPNEIKGAASSIASFVNWLLAFVVTRTFEDMVDGIGTNWTFWTYAIFCIIASFFIYFNVIETKGKTLEQIQIELGGTERSEAPV